MLSQSEQTLLCAYATRTGVEAIRPTERGLEGTFDHGGEVVGIELVVDAKGSIEMLCTSGPSAGECGEVCTLTELRAGISLAS